MPRTAQTILGVVALLLLVAGTAFAVRNPAGVDHRSPVAASHQPAASHGVGAPQDENLDENETEDAAPTEQLVDKLVAQLAAAGIETDAATLTPLIEANGVGGAVRILAWANATGTSTDDLQQMRDDGMGWGEMVQQLDADGSLELSPGIGSVMSAGHVHGQGAAAAAAGDHGSAGRDHAPGQNGD